MGEQRSHQAHLGASAPGGGRLPTCLWLCQPAAEERPLHLRDRLGPAPAPTKWPEALAVLEETGEVELKVTVPAWKTNFSGHRRAWL